MSFAFLRSLPVGALVVATLAFTLTSLAAGQAPFVWDQFRGPGRDSSAAADLLPRTLPATLTEEWRVPVGEGYAGPLVVGETVYQFAREDGSEVLRALSLTDGSELWRTSYEVAFTPESAARNHGSGPKSTPVHADGRIFTLGITGVLSAVDAADGTVSWRHDFVDRFAEPWPLWGASMSPMVLDDRLIAHVGGDREGALMAFQAATGEVIWANDEFTPGYASPILVEVDGTSALVTLSNENVIAVDAADGSTLWSMRYATSSWQNAVTPLATGDRVVISGLDMDIFAVRLAGGAPGMTVSEAWRNDQQPMYMTSPVLVEGMICGMTHRRRGQFFCLDGATGEPVWTSRGREGENAVFTVLGDRIAVLTDEGRLVIVDATAGEYTPIAEYEVADSPTWAPPAFTPEGVLIKDHGSLALLAF